MKSLDNLNEIIEHAKYLLSQTENTYGENGSPEWFDEMAESIREDLCAYEAMKNNIREINVEHDPIESRMEITIDVRKLNNSPFKNPEYDSILAITHKRGEIDD